MTATSLLRGRLAWLAALLPGLVLFLLPGGLPAADPPRWNIVLIVADDLGPDLGCYGNPILQTPHLDALAAEGTRFSSAFCTTASCSASRSVILTGLFNHANGHYGHQHSYHKFSAFGNVASLPVLLKAAGYRTARVGKLHVAPESVFAFDTTLPANARHPVAMADRCREVLDDSQAPFFLYFCTADPHRGGGAAAEIEHRPDRFGNPPPGQQGDPGVREITYSPGQVQVPPFLPDTPACRAELAQYYQSVSRVDQGVGRLVAHLRTAGVLDRTVIVFISDHGIAFPGAKTTVYEPGLRSPCLVRHPGIRRRGVTSDALVSWVDLVPTLLDVAGAWDAKDGRPSVSVADRQRQAGEPVAKIGRLHGRSFLDQLGTAESRGWDEVYASHTFHEITMYYPMRAVRTRRYKLIWNLAHPLPFPFASDLWEAPTWQAQFRLGKDAPYGKRTVNAYIHRPQWELFDLQEDPHETKNLADRPEHADLLAELQGRLKAFQERTGDPWLLKWQYE